MHYVESRWPDPPTPPGNVRVEANPPELLALLWIRHTWVSNALSDMPSELPEAVTAPHRPGLVEAWERLWSGAVAALREGRPPPTTDARMDGSAHLAARLRAAELLGESDLERLGHVAELASWAARIGDNIGAEYGNKDELTFANRAGLRVVVQIPVVGFWEQKVGDWGLLVSYHTRNDPEEYFRAVMRYTYRTR